MAQEQLFTSPPPQPLGDLQAPTEALMMLVGRLMVEGLVKDHTIAMLTHRIGELEMDLQKLRIGVTE